MYERMLDKQNRPSMDEMKEYCGDMAELFASLNEWLSSVYQTTQEQSFPYGKQYGWGITHRNKKKLMCHIFAERNAFTVMMRVSDAQCEAIYAQVQRATQEYLDQKYPCGDGGWIHFRVTGKEQFADIQTLLTMKCS